MSPQLSALSVATVLIRIEDEGERRPVLLFEETEREWLAQPTAQGELPDVALPQLDWETERTGAEAIRDLLLGEAGASDDFEVVGRHLYAMLAGAGEAGTRLQERLDGGQRTRLLLDVRPSDLARLPWELLFHGHRWLSIDVTNPLVRVTDAFPGVAAPSPIRWPLRILVVIGSEKEDRVVEAEAEISNLNDAFRRMSGLVDVEFLHQPGRTDVRAAYAKLRPHIFHFIGHGDVDNERGRLFLYDPDTKADTEWPVSMIRADLAGWQPRLAILNACRSTSVEEQEGAWRVADAFHGLNVPAVIAMQADVRGEAAAVFTGALYGQLAAGASLDAAVTAGRHAMTVGAERLRDFALPSLAVSSPPEKILRLRFGVGDGVGPDVPHLQEQWKHFVDRSEERRLLWRTLDPDPDPDERPEGEQAPDPGALAIVGLTQVGKSELAKWCAIACESHGGNAAYVDFGRAKHVPLLNALHLIREQLARSTLHGDANRKAFERWSEDMRALNLDREAEDRRPPADALETAFGWFSDALRTAANELPLLLVLDHVGKVPEEDWNTLCEWLLLPIAERRVLPVRAIVVLSEEQRTVRLTPDLGRLISEPIELTRFRPRDFRPVVGEYMRSRFDVDMRVLEASLQTLPTPEREFDWNAILALAGYLRGTKEWRAYA